MKPKLRENRVRGPAIRCTKEELVMIKKKAKKYFKGNMSQFILYAVGAVLNKDRKK